MSQRKAMTRRAPRSYTPADGAAKGVILDESCATAGWPRRTRRELMQPAEAEDHAAAEATSASLRAEMIAAQGLCWAVLSAPNWVIVRTVLHHHHRPPRRQSSAVLNKIWMLRSLMTKAGAGDRRARRPRVRRTVRCAAGSDGLGRVTPGRSWTRPRRGALDRYRMRSSACPSTGSARRAGALLLVGVPRFYRRSGLSGCRCRCVPLSLHGRSRHA
jgi:hypothetical protein